MQWAESLGGPRLRRRVILRAFVVMAGAGDLVLGCAAHCEVRMAVTASLTVAELAWEDLQRRREALLSHVQSQRASHNERKVKPRDDRIAVKDNTSIWR